MAATIGRRMVSPLHPLHAVFLAGALPLFLGALLCDWAYSASYHIQWSNFASWLIVGGLIFAAPALLWALVDLLRFRGRGRALAYPLLLGGAWVLGFVNALMHAKDAWAMMPEGLILSVIVVLLLLAAVWIAFSSLRRSG